MTWKLVIWTMYLTSVPQLTTSLPMGSEDECKEQQQHYVELFTLQTKKDPRFRFDVGCVGIEKEKGTKLSLSGLVPWEWRYGQGFAQTPFTG